MRIILSILLCFVLFRTECFALHASNSQGSGIPVNVVGTYAGVMLPFDPNEISTDVNDIEFITAFNAANALAIFTLTVPVSGLATGRFLAFAAGRSYVGTIDGFGDSGTGRIFAVLDADFVDDDVFDIFDFTSIKASGRMAATVSQFFGFGFNSGIARIFGRARIEATSTDTFTTPPTVVVDGIFDLFVDGVKQT